MATDGAKLTLEEIHNVIDKADTGAALTATTEQFTGGTLASTIDAAQAKSDYMLRPNIKDSSFAVFNAVRHESITAYLINTVIDAARPAEFVDYDSTLNHGENARNLLKKYSIPETNENVSALLKGGTTEDQQTIVIRLVKHQSDLDVLGRHSAIAFASFILEPIIFIALIIMFIYRKKNRRKL